MSSVNNVNTKTNCGYETSSSLLNNTSSSSPSSEVGYGEGAVTYEHEVAMLTEALISTKKLWLSHEVEFRHFWDKLSLSSREDFLRGAYPTIVQSLEDKYFLSNREKVYEGTVDHILLLAPTITVSYLRVRDNLPELISEWVADDNLFVHCIRLIAAFRDLYRRNRYPFSPEEKAEMFKQLNIKSGDILVKNEPKRIGCCVSIDNPDMLKGSTDGETNAYDHGCLCHLFEFDTVSAVMQFVVGMLAPVVDKFRISFLDQGKQFNVAPSVNLCEFCGTSGVSLKKCGKCMLTAYCGKECQKAHWGEHKRRCKDAVKALEAKRNTLPKEDTQQNNSVNRSVNV